jgi:hypothetical protein
VGSTGRYWEIGLSDGEVGTGVREVEGRLFEFSCLGRVEVGGSCAFFRVGGQNVFRVRWCSGVVVWLSVLC